MFDLGEQHLDRVQVGRVFGQQTELGTDGSDGRPPRFAFMTAEIVHDHEIAGIKRRRHNLLDIE